MSPGALIRACFEIVALNARDDAPARSAGRYYRCVQDDPDTSRQCAYITRIGNLDGTSNNNNLICLKRHITSTRHISTGLDSDALVRIMPPQHAEWMSLSYEDLTIVLYERYNTCATSDRTSDVADSATAEQKRAAITMLFNWIRPEAQPNFASTAIAADQPDLAGPAIAGAQPDVASDSEDNTGSGSLTASENSDGHLASSVEGSPVSAPGSILDQADWNAAPMHDPSSILPVNPINLNTMVMGGSFFEHYLSVTPQQYFNEPHREAWHLQAWVDGLPFPYTICNFASRIVAQFPPEMLDAIIPALQQNNPVIAHYLVALPHVEPGDIWKFIPEAVFVALNALAKDAVARATLPPAPTPEAFQELATAHGRFCYETTRNFIEQEIVAILNVNVYDNLFGLLPSICEEFLSFMKSASSFTAHLNEATTGEATLEILWQYPPGLYDEGIKRDYGYSLLAIPAWAAHMTGNHYTLAHWGWENVNPVDGGEAVRYWYTFNTLNLLA